MGRPKIPFDRHVTINDNGCHEWDCAPGKYGTYKDASGYVQRAHRYAWIKAHGDPGPDLCVCHKCDNPRCVNVDHMFLGTRAVNNADRAAKGRSGRIHTTKLNPEAVRAIRFAYSNKIANQVQIARAYGMDHTTIGKIVRREYWRHV